MDKREICGWALRRRPDYFNRQTGIFTHFRNNPSDKSSISHNRVRCLFKDSSGVMWVGTSKGLSRFNGAEEGFTRFVADPRNPKSITP